MLTQTKLKELLDYDPITGVFTWKANTSSRNVIGTVAGYTRGYVFIRIHKKLMYAHRLAFLYMTGGFPAKVVDHINGNPADNRWINLRQASTLDNRRNSAKSKNNTSGVTGVTWDARKQLWMTRITVQRKDKHLGYFRDMTDAIAARKAAEALYKFHPNHGRPKQ